MGAAGWMSILLGVLMLGALRVAWVQNSESRKTIRPIRGNADYAAALHRIAELAQV